jgi:hypothetical protein
MAARGMQKLPAESLWITLSSSFAVFEVERHRAAAWFAAVGCVSMSRNSRSNRDGGFVSQPD